MAQDNKNLGPVFGASGANHTSGFVPDPGASGGTTRFLREDATWTEPLRAAMTAAGFATPKHYYYAFEFSDLAVSAAARTTWGDVLGIRPGVPDFRMTLTSGTPVPAADQTGQATLYYTPYVGNRLVTCDSTYWQLPEFGIQPTLTSATNYDVYLYTPYPVVSSVDPSTDQITFTASHGLHTGAAVNPTSGTNDFSANVSVYFARVVSSTVITLHASLAGAFANTGKIDLTASTVFTVRALALVVVAWTDATTRSVSLGVSSNGLYNRNGNDQYTYVGTVRASAANAIDDSVVNRFVWNLYNQRPRRMYKTDATVSWTYGTSSYRAARGDATNCVNYVCGMNDWPVEAHVGTNISAASDAGHVGIGVDSTTVNSAIEHHELLNNNTAAVIAAVFARYSGHPGVGFHTLTWLEYRRTGTPTFYGTNVTVVQAGISGTVWG